MRKIIGKKNKVQYVDETTRFKMVKSHKGWLVIGASMLALAVGLNISVTTAHASQIDGQWAPRTVQEIKADFIRRGYQEEMKGPEILHLIRGLFNGGKISEQAKHSSFIRMINQL